MSARRYRSVTVRATPLEVTGPLYATAEARVTTVHRLRGLSSTPGPFCAAEVNMLAELRRELDDYWPRYLAHHTHRKNRALHDLGDLAVIAGCLTLHPIGVGAGVVVGYGFAFAGHYLIEGRRPATLEHPVLAGLSNWRMFALGCAGRLDDELARYGLESEGEVSFGVEVWRERVLARLCGGGS